MTRRDDAVAAVILAAGSSSRMGSPKQLLHFRGESLLRRAALAAQHAGCDPIIVVTGAHAELTRRELGALDVREVFNAEWHTGMASSIRAGMTTLVATHAPVHAAILMLCDQPLVSAEVLAQLIATYRATRAPVVASRYGKSFGVPALFAHALFPELTNLRGPAGAKQVIERHAATAQFVPFAGGAIDIDTAEDFEELTRRDAGDAAN